MHVLEILAASLGAVASCVVILSAVPFRRSYLWLRDAHRRAEAVEDLAEMHNWPGRPPAGHIHPRGNRVHSA